MDANLIRFVQGVVNLTNARSLSNSTNAKITERVFTVDILLSIGDAAVMENLKTSLDSLWTKGWRSYMLSTVDQRLEIVYVIGGWSIYE